MGNESEEYTDWWFQTSYGRMDAQKKKGRINWDARQSSDVWKHFDQVANAKDGKPKVACKQCKVSLGSFTAWKWDIYHGQACQRVWMPEESEERKYQGLYATTGTIV